MVVTSSESGLRDVFFMNSQLIMSCVTSTSFSISINGDIHGYRVTPFLLTYSHDLFNFARGEVESARLIMKSLSELSVKYLGVPLISSRLLNKDGKILVERDKNRIGDWKNESLSFAGIIQDFQQHMRGFLWCNGELKRGKAKVAWENICLSKSESSLGIRSLEDVPIKSDLSWGWLKLLQIRDLVKPFFWITIGNGKSTSVWFDNWCSRSPLIMYLTPRDITSEGFNIKSCVADLVANRGAAWEALRPRGVEVSWYHVVWFSHCMENVPPHLHDIMLELQPIAHIRSAKSVFGRLIVATTSYLVWLEHNNRIFKKVRRSPKEIRDIIMVTIRLKLLSFRFKNTAMVHNLLSCWKIPSNFRLYS
ncbi:hypothetical protein Tco_0110126 [Tanacetum coccineum]